MWSDSYTVTARLDFATSSYSTGVVDVALMADNRILLVQVWLGG